MKIPKSYCIYLSIAMFGLFIQGCRKDEVNNPIQVQRTVLSTYIPYVNELIINGLYQNTLWYKAIN